MRWAGYAAVMGEMIEIPEREGLLGRSRHRWEDNIRMNLRGIGRNIVDWIHLDQDREQRWVL
jgi:hypothetical protein